MRRVIPVVVLGALGALVIATAVFLALKVINHDGRSPYEQMFNESPAVPQRAVSLASCPASEPYGPTLRERNRRSPKELVPGGAVEVLLCRYHGFGTDTPRSYDLQEQLAAKDVLRAPAAVTSITREFDRLAHLPSVASTSCVHDNGARLFAIFPYPKTPPVAVEVALDDCLRGEVRGRPLVAITAGLAKRLRRLTGAGPSAVRRRRGPSP